MPTHKVKVKWQKSTYDLEVNTDEPPLLFKAQIFDVTGVAPERQKVILKGVTLKDESWEKIPVKDNVTFLMMGSKEEEIPKEPIAKIVFAEDLDPNDLNAALDLPGGLKNLGNTCYLNATLQCLLGIPELKEALIQLPRANTLQQTEGSSGPRSEGELFLGQALRELMKNIASGKTQVPFILLQTVHQVFPQFSQKNEQGVLMQQDANECWTELIALLRRIMPCSEGEGKNMIDKYLRGTFTTKLTNTENAEEAATEGEEVFYQLSCFINQEVKYLESGLRSRLVETMTKHSPSLDRDAVYSKEAKISRLPAYLSIQFVRFYYKEKEGINAKILKDVKFPMVLDVYELCSPELQTKLLPMRAKFKVEDDRLASEKAKKDDPKALKGKGARTVAESAGEDSEGVQEPTSFPDDEGSNNSGFYELTGVLTHQGRSSSSGHYVAWVRHKKDVWLKFDDDEVSGVSAEDVLRLSGGGDWHCAYVLVYGPRQLVSHPPSPSTAAGAETKQETPANGKEEVQKMETS